MKKLTALFFFLFCFIFAKSALAVTITINNYPSLVTSDPFSINVSIIGASTGQNYIRADLYKDGTSNYFGETFNGSSWYGGSTGTSYFPIAIVDSKTTASANLQVKIGSPTSAEFPGSGTYKLKIRRYTGSGNAAGGDDQTPVDVAINYSSTVTATPTQKSSTPTTSSSKTTPTKSPTPTKAPTVTKPSNATSTNVSTTNKRQIVNNSDKIATDFARVQNSSPTENKAPEVAVLGESKKELPSTFLATVGGFILLLLGLGLLARNNWEKIKIWLENI